MIDFVIWSFVVAILPWLFVFAWWLITWVGGLMDFEDEGVLASVVAQPGSTCRQSAVRSRSRHSAACSDFPQAW